MYSDKQHNQRSNWSLENNILNTVKVKRKYTFYHFYDFTFQDEIKNYLVHGRSMGKYNLRPMTHGVLHHII